MLGELASLRTLWLNENPISEIQVQPALTVWPAPCALRPVPSDYQPSSRLEYSLARPALEYANYLAHS